MVRVSLPCVDTAEVLLSVGRTLWGIPTPELRTVAVSWQGSDIMLRFIYDKPVEYFERELASLCGTYTVADFPTATVAEQAVHIAVPQALVLAEGEQWVYLRYEPDHQENTSI